MAQSPDLEKLLKHFCIIQFGPHGIGKQVDQVSHLGCGLQCPDSQIFNALMLTGFFRFYRLATLVPPSQSGFPPCACSIITKCAKNIQTSRQVQVIQLSELSDKSICRITALRAIVSTEAKWGDQPLFIVMQREVFL